SHRAAADHGDFEGQFALTPSRIYIDRILGFRAVPLGQKTLERADCNRAIDISTATGSFTGMRTNPAADARQRVRIAGKPVSFLKSPFRNERHVPARVGMGWASHHAGKVGVQPVPVHFLVLEPLQQDGNPLCIRLVESILLEQGEERTWPPAPYFPICSM